MFRYVTKVSYAYGTVDGKTVPVSKTVYQHDRFEKFFGGLATLRGFIVTMLFPACCIAGAVVAVGMLICCLL